MLKGRFCFKKYQVKLKITNFKIATNLIQTPSGEHYIGEKYGGGIIFYLNKDRDSGLIVRLDGLNSGNS